MPKKKAKIKLCPMHLRVLPCLSCRGMKGGLSRSPKKARANAAKAQRAANIRWGNVKK